VFRSDALHRITRHDVARLRALRIGDILDLRSSAELEAEGRGPLAHEPIRFHHVPLFDGDTRGRTGDALSLADRYLLLAEFAMAPIARTIAILAGTDAPAVYHCAAGKDRTGVVTAILLGSLDVDDDTIAGDYALTQENLDAIVDRLNETDAYQAMLAALPPDTLHAKPDTMLEFVGRLRAKYGSIASYAEAAGVAPDTLQAFTRRLIE
jgi:protein-tyrosine phosphatase